ncbi:ESX secretion-associated protein EspG [Nocardia sp. NPDC051052]|uniref:ESX secretion-associated protein EspG n=1 Tax=Nocardia sp. NPDC051052 TaxID=3364322 RepID=UPI0037A292CE
MIRTWNLTDVELIVLWHRLFTDRLPQPLFALYRGADGAEWERLTADARHSLRAKEDGVLHGALDRVAHADIQVAVYAFDPRNPGDPCAAVRMLGAQQGSMATLIRQLPGETCWHSSGFVVSLTAAEGLARLLAAALPACDAGRLPDTPLVLVPGGGDTDHQYGRSLVYDSDLDAERRSAAWLAHPVERDGLVETSLGSSIFGPRGVTAHRIFWRDLVGDGRYAFADTGAPIATAVDTRRLAAMITADITKVSQTLEDERCV